MGKGEAEGQSRDCIGMGITHGEGRQGRAERPVSHREGNPSGIFNRPRARRGPHCWANKRKRFASGPLWQLVGPYLAPSSTDALPPAASGKWGCCISNLIPAFETAVCTVLEAAARSMRLGGRQMCCLATARGRQPNVSRQNGQRIGVRTKQAHRVCWLPLDLKDLRPQHGQVAVSA